MEDANWSIFYGDGHRLSMAVAMLACSDLFSGNGDNENMTSEEMNSILSKPNNAIVGVNRAQGGPQLTTIWYAWDGTSFYFSTTTTRAKYGNMKRDPSISLIVDDPETHKYVAAYGQAEIIEQNIAELTRSIIKKYAPAEQVERSVTAISNDPTRVIVVLHPDKIVTN